jgi:hypothetical protein
VLRDLEQRFGLKRVVFVGDRGRVKIKNHINDISYLAIPPARKRETWARSEQTNPC